MHQDRHRWSPVCAIPEDLVRPVAVDPTGKRGPTRGQAAGPRWRRSSRGLYVPSHVDAERPEQRILEQAMRLPGGAVTGWASLRMHGAAFFDGLRDGGRSKLPVPLSTSPFHQVCPLAGDDVIRDILNPWEIEPILGVPCTTPERATFDAARFAPSLRAAVVAMDMSIAAGLTTLAGMVDYVGRKQTWTGVQRARDALVLADENSWSPPETRLRLIWVLDARRPRPLTNRPLFDLYGNLLGYPDLIDPVAGVVGEYDGADHREAEAHSSDVDREAVFRRHYLEVFRVTGPDMNQPARVVRRIHAAYDLARFVVPGDRTWTLVPPPWWRARLAA